MSKARDIASASPAPSTVSTTELGYLDGVTSAVQTQLNRKPEYAAGKNGSINGGFDIWQRGTSFSASSPIYTADRWNLNASSTHTLTRQTVSDTTNLPTIQYCARIQRTNGTFGSMTHYLTQSLESSESYRYAGQTVTLSFYARKGANFSSTYLQSWVYYGTGTDENITGTYTGAAGLGGQNNTLTTTWQRFTMTVSIDKSATELALFFAMESTGTSGAADYFEITGVQLELGSTATTFSRAGGTITGELAECQRYYFRYTGGNGSRFAVGNVESTTTTQVPFYLPSEMRTTPSLSFTSVGVRYAGSSDVTISTVTSGAYTINMRVPLITVSSAVLTIGQAVILRGNAAPSIIEFNSEL